VEIGLVDLFDASPERNPEFMAEFGRTAEACGFSGIWLPEHLLFFDEYTSEYPYPDAPNADNPETTAVHNKTVGGKPRVEASADQGLLDIFQAAAEVCRATTKLRIGSSVLLLPVRNVNVLARELTTLAALTDGRFDLGVGVGWSAEEFAAVDSPFKQRGRRCQENLAALQAMDISLPRIVVGGHSPAAIRRAATVASGWYPWNLTPAQFEEHHTTFCREIDAIGGDRSDYHVIAGLRFLGEPESLRAMIDRYEELGADGINISLRMTADNYADTMHAISDALGLAA
jgi:alkanesulfonate monooxygenase SsuD/methylene tetrahydromethanopterin reductase-like flavin-dependent oxidoreductase (luciferase family)